MKRLLIPLLSLVFILSCSFIPPDTLPIETEPPAATQQPAATAAPPLITLPPPGAQPVPPVLAGCPIFPPDNIWNARVDWLPLDPRSDAYVASIGIDEPFHMDFGSGEWDGGPIGIPYNLVDSSQAPSNVEFYYPEESDPGPYPIPPDPLIEGGPDADGDRHILILDTDTCVLYELYDAWPPENAGDPWSAGSGAIYDLASNALRPAGWTSADAAGLPILPGLVRYDEVLSGRITHALRFTVPETRTDYVWPARHFASEDDNPNLPPMGQRFRLRANYDISGFDPFLQVILRAMKEYGIILADNGSPWYISGVPDERWNNDLLHDLDVLTGADFEAVDSSNLMIDPDSGACRQPTAAYLPSILR